VNLQEQRALSGATPYCLVDIHVLTVIAFPYAVQHSNKVNYMNCLSVPLPCIFNFVCTTMMALLGYFFLCRLYAFLGAAVSDAAQSIWCMLVYPVRAKNRNLLRG